MSARALRTAGGVLAVAEARRGALRDVSFELIAAGREIADVLGGPVRVVLLAVDPLPLAGTLAASGADEVLAVPTPVPEFEGHVWAAAVEQLLDRTRPSFVLGGHTVDALGWAPAVAARRGLGFADGVTGLAPCDEGLRVRRPGPGGTSELTLALPAGRPAVLLVREGAFRPSPAPAGADPAPVRRVPLDLAGTARTEHLGYREPAPPARTDIESADILLALGRPADDDRALARLERLAAAMGATICATRPLIESGRLPRHRQVGRSGRIVRPRVYLALGISGATGHLAAVEGTPTIVAVNTDPEAPIFRVADYGATADLFAVADELERLFS